MNIPSSITQAVTKDTTNNNYFYGADQMWRRLTAIRKNQVEYMNIDMAMLVNCMEMYYKGFIMSTGVKVPEVILSKSHNLARLTDEIETRICPLQYNLSRTDERDRRIFLNDFSQKYISCRYDNEQVSRSDFNQCYDWAKKQRTLIMEYLHPKKKEAFLEEEYER